MDVTISAPLLCLVVRQQVQQILRNVSSLIEISRGVGGEPFIKKSLPWGYGYFMESHIVLLWCRLQGAARKQKF